MKRTDKNTNETATVVENDAAAAAEFDAAAAAKEATSEVDTSDPWFAVFTVVATTVLNSPARKEHGEAVEFTITRQRKGSYIASIGEVSGGDKRKAVTAINSVLSAIGARKEEFLFDVEGVEPAMPDKAGDNQAPETWFFDDPNHPQYKAAADAKEEVETAQKKLDGAAVDTRDGWLGFGGACIKLRHIFADAGLLVWSEDKKTAEAMRGNKAWGTFLESRFASSESIMNVLSKKNAVAQAVLYASAPAEVVAVFPSVNTASTFERKMYEIITGFAKSVVEIALNNRQEANNESTEFDGAEVMAVATRKQEANVTKYAADFAQWQKEANEAGEQGKTPAPFKQAGNKAGNVVISWLLSNTDGQAKLDAALAKAWELKIGEPTEEEAEEAAAKKATAAITKKFAEMTVEAAALHLLAILVSHSEAEDVYATLGDKLEEAIAAKAEAAKAAKEAAEKEAAEA